MQQDSSQDSGHNWKWTFTHPNFQPILNQYIQPTSPQPHKSIEYQIGKHP